jgi:hypothetical protein
MDADDENDDRPSEGGAARSCGCGKLLLNDERPSVGAEARSCGCGRLLAAAGAVDAWAKGVAEAGAPGFCSSASRA